LSLLNQGEIQSLLVAILEQSLDSALACFQRMVAQGYELQTILEALLREVKDLTLFGVLGKDNAYFADHLPETLEFYGQRKDAASPDQLQQIFQVLLELEGQLRISGHARACFEMGLVKACRVQPLVGIPELLARAREILRGGSGGMPQRPESSPRAPLPRSRPAAGVGAATLSAPARRPVAPASATGRTAEPRAGNPRVPSADPEEEPEPKRIPEATEAKTEFVGPEAPEPDEGDDPDNAAPCDDPRWVALVQSAGAKGKLLGAQLRKTDVKRIEGDDVEVVLQGRPLGMQDQAVVDAEVKQHFGAAFRLKWIDATSETYRSRRSVAGRKAWRDERARLREIAEAEADPAVQMARRFFPGGKVVQVRLNETGGPKSRRESS